MMIITGFFSFLGLTLQKYTRMHKCIQKQYNLLSFIFYFVNFDLKDDSMDIIT